MWFGEKYFHRSWIRKMSCCISLPILTCLVMHFLLCPVFPWGYTLENGFNPARLLLGTDHSLRFASSGYSCTQAAQLDFLIEVVVLFHLFLKVMKLSWLLKSRNVAPCSSVARDGPAWTSVSEVQLLVPSSQF